MTKTESKATHVTTGNVFADIGFTSEEAAVLRMKTLLHVEIMKAIEKRSLTSRELESVLDVPQPRVSELLSGKISNMSSDKLTKYLHRLGQEVHGMKLKSIPANPRRIAASNKTTPGTQKRSAKKKSKKRA